ncbi:hypothetical protein KIPB_004521 [Kipferlia bialata]|uniref:Uncharacterized protein n=1 Tax=Kipferlia bialata TaxID=797122 RepID=A0A9K3CW38_9EUKA|nr:hypothetical protein KIPB_004521 [Kipferlia bialata]|eukprot:g4521.t1
MASQSGASGLPPTLWDTTYESLASLLQAMREGSGGAWVEGKGKALTIGCASCGECCVKYSEKAKVRRWRGETAPMLRLLSFKKSVRKGTTHVHDTHAPDCPLQPQREPVTATPISLNHEDLRLGRPVAALSPYETLWVYYDEDAKLSDSAVSLAVASHSMSDSLVVEVSDRVSFPEGVEFVRYLARIGGVAYLLFQVTNLDRVRSQHIRSLAMFGLELDTLTLQPTGEWLSYTGPDRDTVAVLGGDLVLLSGNRERRYHPDSAAWTETTVPARDGRVVSFYGNFISAVVKDTLYTRTMNMSGAYRSENGWTEVERIPRSWVAPMKDLFILPSVSDLYQGQAIAVVIPRPRGHSASERRRKRPCSAMFLLDIEIPIQ